MRRLMSVVPPMVKWLYNGVELPALPDFDRAKYPYIIIAKHKVSKIYSICAFAKESYFYSKYGTLYFGGSPDYPVGSVACFSAYCYANYNYWSDHKTWTNENIDIDNSTHELIWTNFDLEYDGTLYMEASEPVTDTTSPVPPPDPLSLLLGWRVGRAVRNMRN